MTWVHWYAIAVTVACIFCAGGWYLAHGVIKNLANVDVEDWPHIRRLLRSR